MGSQGVSRLGFSVHTNISTFSSDPSDVQSRGGAGSKSVQGPSAQVSRTCKSQRGPLGTLTSHHLSPGTPSVDHDVGTSRELLETQMLRAPHSQTGNLHSTKECIYIRPKPFGPVHSRSAAR